MPADQPPSGTHHSATNHTRSRSGHSYTSGPRGRGAAH